MKNDISKKFCYAETRVMIRNIMKKFKAFWRKYWADTKVLYRQYMEEDQQQKNSEYCYSRVNPSTGLPMISSSVDCMGNAFGVRDQFNNRH